MWACTKLCPVTMQYRKTTPYLMKKIFIALFLLSPLHLLHADNLLSNGDFTDGINHWQGDGSQSTFAGLVVRLKPDAWTKVYQDAVLPGAQATLKIAYTLSSDATFSSALQGVQQGPDLSKLLGFSVGSGVVSIHPNSWLIFLVEDVQHFTSYVNVTPRFGTDQLQTTGGTIPNLKGQSGKTLYLAFPPGQGTVILQNVSLSTP
jgi:hypothetical protein